MTFEDVRPFFEQNHRGVVTTYRRNEATQVSIVASGAMEGAIVFVSRGDSAKLANLKRDPRCTVMATQADWSSYAVVEGNAEIRGWDNMDPEELRLLLRDAYSACGDTEHPNWNEFDRVMREERRAVVLVRPEHGYGLFR